MVLALGVGCGGGKGAADNGHTDGNASTQWRLVHAESQSTTLHTLPKFEIQPLAFANPLLEESGFTSGFYRQGVKDTAYSYDDEGELQRVDNFYVPPTYSLKQSTSEERIQLSQEQFLDYAFTGETLELVQGDKKPFFERGELIRSVDYINLSASEWSAVSTHWQKVAQPLTQAGCDGEIFNAAATELRLSDPAPPGTAFDFAEDVTEFCIGKQAAMTTENIFNWDELQSLGIRDEASRPAPTDRVFDPQTGKLIKLTQYNKQLDTDPALIADLGYDNQGRLQTIELKFATPFIITSSAGDIWVTEHHQAEIQYRYPEQGVVIAEIYEVDEGERGLTQTLTATYERAPCGPLTQERDRHQVPSLFPVCL